jgi:hypothetical protein
MITTPSFATTARFWATAPTIGTGLGNAHFTNRGRAGASG